MPLFNLKCTECGEVYRKIADSLEEVGDCKFCGAAVEWQAKGPSVQKKETLDNGVMPRAVERLADAERLFKERAMNADPLAGGANGAMKK